MISLTLAGAVLVTFGIRVCGLIAGRLIASRKNLGEFLTCATYAMLSALTMRLLFMPSDLFDSVSGFVVAGACLTGGLVVSILKQSVLTGIVVSATVFLVSFELQRF